MYKNSQIKREVILKKRDINNNGLYTNEKLPYLKMRDLLICLNGNNQTAMMTYIDENIISVYLNILVISVFLWYHSSENSIIENRSIFILKIIIYNYSIRKNN